MLKPGGYVLAFGSPRTHHCLMCAIEDGGLIIQDCLMWLYSQGCPKNRATLKPGWEAIVLAYRPDGKRELQIEECRVPLGEHDPLQDAIRKGLRPAGLSRWPANVTWDGSQEVMEAFGNTTSRGTNGRFYYCAKATKKDRAGSTHPTVKPVKLLQWLVGLVTPPGGLILDPFAGSGTLGTAAKLEGRDAILIEREAQYIADIERRLAA